MKRSAQYFKNKIASYFRAVSCIFAKYLSNQPHCSFMQYRTEHDSIGPVEVPADKYWAAQTQRSMENFRIGGQQMPLEVIRAFAILKKAAALTNSELGVLGEEKAGVRRNFGRQAG